MMKIINKLENINILIGSIFLFLIVIFNPISWVYFFDSDGFIKFSRMLIFFSFDILCLASSYFLFKNKSNKNYYKSFCSILSFNIFFLFLLLFLLQIIFGNWLYNNPWFNKSVVVSNKLSRYKLNNLYEADFEYINYSRDKFGFRGKYNSVNDINILTIGGSTTDQRYIPDSLTFQEVLRKQFLLNGLNVSIVNAGIDGQSTIGHLNNFHWWFPYIKNLKVDYFLFFIGINDFHILDSKLNDFINADLVNIKNRESTKGKLLSRNIFYQLLNLIDAIYYTRKRGLYHGGHKKMLLPDNIIKEGNISDYEGLMNKDLIAYENRLFELDAKVKEIGSKTIFVTQSRKLYKKHNNEVFGVNDFDKYKEMDINGVDYYHMINLMHQRVKKVSQQTNAIFLNLDLELKFDYSKDLYDDMHTTPSGSEKIGKYLFSKLEKINF